MSDSQVRATEVREAYNCFRKAIYRCRNEANTQEEKSLYTNLIDTLSKVNYKIEALKSVSMEPIAAVAAVTVQFLQPLAGKIESMKVNFPIGDSHNDGYGYGYNYGFYDGHGEGGGLSILFGYTDDFSGGGSGRGYSSTVDDTAGHGDGCCFGDSFGNGAGYGFSFVGRIGFDCGRGYGNGVDTVSTATRRRD